MALRKFEYINSYRLDIDIPIDNVIIKEIDFTVPYTVNLLKDEINLLPELNSCDLIILDGTAWCIDETSIMGHHWISAINSWSQELQKPFLILTGKMIPSKTDSMPDDLNIGFHRLSFFDHLANLVYNRQIVKHRITTYDRDKKLYWANTKDIYWRRYFLAGLHKNNIIEDSLINYKCERKEIPSNFLEELGYSEVTRTHIKQECSSIDHIVPLPSLDDTTEFSNTDISFYLRSYVGLIVETFLDGGVFFSEKIFNCIAYKQIFFYVGGCGAVQYLRKQGYQTFDNIIDTSYDTIADDGQRVISARQSLLDFINQPIEKIKIAYENNIDQIEHNFKLFRQQQNFPSKYTKIIEDFLKNEKAT